VKYIARYPEVEAIRFEPDPAIIGRIRKLIGSENVKKESTFINDEFYIKLDGVWCPLRESEYVVLMGGKVKTYTVSRFLEMYEIVRE
jgi:hypothetical protein